MKRTFFQPRTYFDRVSAMIRELLRAIAKMARCRASGPEHRRTPDAVAAARCYALYVRPAEPHDYLGGSEPRMLHGAAEKIAQLDVGHIAGQHMGATIADDLKSGRVTSSFTVVEAIRALADSMEPGE